VWPDDRRINSAPEYLTPPDPRHHGDGRDGGVVADVPSAGSTPPNTPALHHIWHLDITVGHGLDIGSTPAGFRRVIPITGGRGSGPLMTGRVLTGGAWITEYL